MTGDLIPIGDTFRTSDALVQASHTGVSLIKQGICVGIEQCDTNSRLPLSWLPMQPFYRGMMNEGDKL